MAAGDTWILDNAEVMVGATAADQDISGYVASAMVHLEHPEVPTPHTFGQAGQRTTVSGHYTVTVTLDLITDNFDAGSLDRIFRAFMKPPFGASTSGEAFISIAPDGSQPSGPTSGTATNPSFSGKIVVSQWDLLGSGAVGEIVRQSRTFTGTGNWTIDDA